MSKAKSGGMMFLKQATGSEETKMVSARVALSIYDDFQQAVQVASKAGYSLSVTEVITEALKAAVKEVRNVCGEEAFQGELPLSDKPESAKPATKTAAVKSTQPAQGNISGNTTGNTQGNVAGNTSVKQTEPVKK